MIFKVGRMKCTSAAIEWNITRGRLIRMLNRDLASEYRAIVAFIVYSQILKRADYAGIARELELHAAGNFQHARTVANRIDRLGGVPCVKLGAGNATHDPVTTLLSNILRGQAFQIDMASLLGVGSSAKCHPVPESLWKNLSNRARPSAKDPDRSKATHARRNRAKPGAGHGRSARMPDPS